jgi:hypothetical protein
VSACLSALSKPELFVDACASVCVCVCVCIVQNYADIWCLYNKYTHCNETGDAVGQLVEALRYKPEGRGFDWNWISLEFFIDIIFSVSASNRNEYKEYFLGGGGVNPAGA